MQRLGVVDLGSGTSRLVVYAYRPGEAFQLVDEIREPVRLGEGLGRTGRLTEAGMARALSALRLYRDFARATGLKDLVVVATSAVRDAANGPEFLERARGLGLEVRVLSGAEEARYGLLAVANGFPWEEAWVVDLGGGSAQIARMAGRGFAWGEAYPAGALRLTEAFLRSHPPRRAQAEALEAHLRRTLAPALEAMRREPLPLVAMGGTVRNLARLAQRREAYPLDLLHGYRLTREALEEVVAELQRLSPAQRARLPGLQPDRAETILAGALFYRTLLRETGLEGIWVSGQGLREGVFYERFLPPPHLLPEVRAFSVRNLFARFPQDPGHTGRVQALAQALFRGLAPLHGYGPEEARLLEEAALLHDIGMALGYYDHHKHGAYLVLAQALPGLTHREQALLALLVRYHRKGEPGLGAYKPLMAKGDGRRLLRLSALLRLAEHLERARTGRVEGVEVALGGDRVLLGLKSPVEPWVELVEVRKQAGLFRKAFGLDLEVRWLE